MAERTPLPEDPRDLIIPDDGAADSAEDGLPLVNLKVKVPAYLARECEDAVSFLADTPERLTMEILVEMALHAYLKALRETYNKGRPFPSSRGD